MHTASPQPTTSEWEGYTQKNFVVDGRPCLLVVPKSSASGNPWIWRTEFFGAFPQVDVALLAKGYHVAYLNVENMYGAPAALDHMDKFYKELTENHALSPKCVLEGFSRGGLFAFNWAVRNPSRVECIYADAPVCDFKSWPGGKGSGPCSPDDWERCKAVYHLTEEQALAYTGNPLDNLKPLAEAKLPVIAVYGDVDAELSIEENVLILADRYKKLGGEIKVIVKPGIGHHPHSLEDPTPVVDFIINHRSKGKG